MAINWNGTIWNTELDKIIVTEFPSVSVEATYKLEAGNNTMYYSVILADQEMLEYLSDPNDGYLLAKLMQQTQSEYVDG